MRIPCFTLHTGQHYSCEMDRIFFEELELPQPKYNLDVGSGRADRTFASTPVPGELKDYKNTELWYVLKGGFDSGNNR